MFESLTKRLTDSFKRLAGKGRITESDVLEMLREVRVALLEADVNFGVVKEFIANVKQKAIGADVYGSLDADQTIIKIVRDELVELLGVTETQINWSSSLPTVVLMCGLQGSGKTTTTAKLALWLIKKNKSVMLAACDTQRPAAITQLEQLGQKLEIPVYAKHDNASPLEIAREALSKAKYLLKDVLIIDTAGRLNIDDELMQELEAIQKITNPTEILLVLDSSIGQEAVNVARDFNEKLRLTGTIFTKLDGDTRGGAVLSVRAALGLPIKFIGIGEQIEALDVFYPDRMAQRILGMGDVLGLIEKVENIIEPEDADYLKQRVKKGDLNFEDMLMQLKAIKKMGPIKNVLKMIPGLSGAINDEMLGKVNDKQFTRVEAIIGSMTVQERRRPEILKASRKRRVALGSGTTVQEVNQLIKQLEDMRKKMKSILSLEKKYNKGRRR